MLTAQPALQLLLHSFYPLYCEKSREMRGDDAGSPGGRFFSKVLRRFAASNYIRVYPYGRKADWRLC